MQPAGTKGVAIRGFFAVTIKSVFEGLQVSRFGGELRSDGGVVTELKGRAKPEILMGTSELSVNRGQRSPCRPGV